MRPTTTDLDVLYKEQKERMNEYNDCVVRAFAFAHNMPYEIAHKLIEKHFGRKRRQGTLGVLAHGRFKTIKETHIYYYNTNSFKRYNRDHMVTVKYEDMIYHTEALGKGITVARFCKENPTGTYIVSKAQHSFVIKDGVVYNYGEANRRTMIRTAMKVEV